MKTVCKNYTLTEEQERVPYDLKKTNYVRMKPP